MKVSASELKTYKRCLRKWYWAYVENWGLKREVRSGPRAIGTRVHRALELFYREGTDPTETVLAGFASDFATYPEQEAELKKDQELALAMVEGYLEWLEEKGSDAELEFLEEEREIEYCIPDLEGPNGEPVFILAKLDALVRRMVDANLFFLDHKSVQSFMQATATLQKDEQMLMYHMLLYIEQLAKPEEEQVQVLGGMYNMLKRVKRTARAKPPFFERHVVEHNVEELRAHWVHTMATIVEMIGRRRNLALGQNWQEACYPNPTRDCSWD